MTTLEEIGLIAGIGAALAFLASVWDQIQQIFHWISGLVIVEHRCKFNLAGPLIAYLSETGYRSERTNRYYSLRRVFVQPVGTLKDVIFEHIDFGNRWFWNRRRLMWYVRELDDGTGDFDFRFYYIRGTVNWEALIKEAVHWQDQSFDDDSKGNRFSVIKVFGSSNESDECPPRGSSVKSGGSNSESFDPVRERPLGWEVEDIGPPGLSSLEMMSLNDDLKSIVEEARGWLNAESWYRDRGIPWRRSFGFEGNAGTGKTSLTRAIAEDFNMPLYMIDLGSMDNRELSEAWHRVTQSSPAVILLEDLDSVFKGRQNIAKDGELTFDALLNCIDGPDKADGILLIITTNHIAHLDPALRRPGRMDHIVHFTPLDYAGRYKLAMRILDDTETAEQMSNDNDTMTAAEFQEACCRIAIGRHFQSIKTDD